MYGIFTYIWAIIGVNVGKYSIHGASGIVIVSYEVCLVYHIAVLPDQMVGLGRLGPTWCVLLIRFETRIFHCQI